MRKDIAKLFDIQALILYTLKFDGQSIYIKVGKIRKEATCPRCQTLSRRIHAYGRGRKVKHQKLGDKLVYLVFKPRRFITGAKNFPGGLS